MKQSGIYKITNKVNGKIYIGQSVNVKARIRSHKTSLKNNTHHNELLQKSYNKHGKLNFKFEVIELCSLEELDEREIDWILYYDATDREYGYNFESGGNTNKKMHDETKEKIRLRNRASSDILTVSDVREIKMALALNIQHEELCDIYNVHISTISKINKCNNWEWVLPKLNAQLINKQNDIKKKRDSRIEALYKEGYNGSQVSEITNIPISYVRKYLNGRKNIEMEDRYEKIREDYRIGLSKKEILEKYGVTSNVFEAAIPNVHFMERLELHNKILEMHNLGMKNVEIANALGVHRTTVTEHLKKRVDITKKQTPLTDELKRNIINLHNEGFSQRKIAEKLSIGRINVKKTLNEISFQSKKLNREIVQLDKEYSLVRIWNSINEAGSFLNLTPTGIGACCKGKQKTAGGYKWMYKEDYEKYIAEQNKELVLT